MVDEYISQNDDVIPSAANRGVVALQGIGFFVAMSVGYINGIYNLHGWSALFFGFLFGLGYLVTFAVLLPIYISKRRLISGNALFFLIVVWFVFLVSSFFLLGDNGDSSGQYFRGKSYDVGDPGLGRVSKIGGFANCVWVISQLIIFITLIVVASRKDKQVRAQEREVLTEVQLEEVDKQTRLRTYNIIHVGTAFCAVAVIFSINPLPQVGYRTFLDAGIVPLLGWLLFFTSAIMFLMSRKPLRSSYLLYIYETMGIIAMYVASSRTKDLYAVRYSGDVVTLKTCAIIVVVLISMMFRRSALYEYKKVAE